MALAAQPRTSAPALVDVLEEHLEELAFLSIQRRKLAFSPEIPMRRLRRHDERIEAHRDGLRIGEKAGVAVAVERLAGDDPWLLAAAGRVWIEQSGATSADVLRHIASAPPESRAAWREALRTTDRRSVERILTGEGWPTVPAASLAIAVDAAAWHGLLPRVVEESAIASVDREVRRALARHTRDDVRLRRLVSDADLEVRRVALWSLTLARVDAGLESARAWIRADEPDSFAVRVLGLTGDEGDGERIAALVDHPRAGTAALYALGDLGLQRFAALLVERVESPAETVAEAACEALECIAGTAPATSGKASPIELARTRLAALGRDTGTGRRWLRGAAHPWTGDPREEPMESLWRSSIATLDRDHESLRRDVPDGFFSGLPDPVARPGE